MTEEPAKRWFQATGIPFSSRPAEIRSNQYGRYMSCWISSSRVHTTLTGPSTCMRDLDGAHDAVDFQPAAKAAADADDCAPRPCPAAGRRLCRRSLNARDGLAADPDFAAVLANVNGAVHRLHRRVREERNLVGRLDLGDGARHGLVGVADILRNGSGTERRLFELAADVVGVELGVRTVVPFDHQRCQAFLRGAHVVGDDGDGVVEPHDLTHALDGFGRRIVHALHATAEDGRLRKGRDLHARRPNVDAVDRRAIDLRRCVEPLGRRADELEILAAA